MGCRQIHGFHYECVREKELSGSNEDHFSSGRNQQSTILHFRNKKC